MTEPMTAVTDWLLAGLAVVLAGKLRRAPEASGSHRLMAWSFFCLAGAALLGGAVHGFAPLLTEATRPSLWRVIYLGIGLANLLLLAAVGVAVTPRPHHPLLLGLLALRLAVFLVLSRDRGFGFVLADLLLSLVLLLGLGLFSTFIRRRSFGPWLLAGGAVSLVGALVQARRLAPHPSFNHNDLFHVIQMAGIFLFYLAARAMESPNAQGLTKKRNAD